MEYLRGVTLTPAASLVPTDEELGALAEKTRILCATVAQVLSGKEEVIETTIAVLLARGHLLLEDVPGVGKTTLATAIGKALNFTVSRIQFTPDMLPSDLTGVNIYRNQTGTFDFRPGPLFAQIVIGDEVNRASPKTQSALLECMQEGQVSIDGTSHELPSPFFVIATQNPIEMEGTYPLPEAQRDRFTARIEMGYPSSEDEFEMLGMHEARRDTSEIQPVLSAQDIEAMTRVAESVYASDLLKQYVIDLVRATRNHPDLRLGASPRAAIQLLSMAKVKAAMARRNHVLPQDVQQLVHPVLAHRVLPRGSASDREMSAQVLQQIVDSVPVRIYEPGS